MIQNPHIEVLAPAGDFSALQAAIDSGADAIYFGLAQLNMRAKARRNFEEEHFQEIVERCHKNNVQALLTLNTIVYDHDLKLVNKLLDQAKALKVDAVIAADLAVIQACRDRDLEVHLSTQLSVSNYEAFKFYSQWCDRIVLARELTLPLIKKIHQKIVANDLRGPAGRPMEIEAFAHGALCIAMSGRCNMSLFTDNASANRGACVQNCRKSYIIKDEHTGQELKVDNNFIMSPNDISTIEFLDQLIDAGISVLKIEGRARSPEYVSRVTKAYKSAVEAIQEGRYNPEFVETLLSDLNSVYNRGLSSGYYLGKAQGWSEAHGSKATHRKIEVGKITKFYNNISVAEILATSGFLKKGENYLITGNTTGALEGTVEQLRIGTGEIVESIQAKDIFSIKVTKKVRPGDRVWVMRPIENQDPKTSNQKLPIQLL